MVSCNGVPAMLTRERSEVEHFEIGRLLSVLSADSFPCKSSQSVRRRPLLELVVGCAPMGQLRLPCFEALYPLSFRQASCARTRWAISARVIRCTRVASPALPQFGRKTPASRRGARKPTGTTYCYRGLHFANGAPGKIRTPDRFNWKLNSHRLLRCPRTHGS